MSYATTDDVVKRCRRQLTEAELTTCESLLEDAGIIIDAWNENAKAEAKKVVSCNMVIRALGDGSSAFPVGATQGTVSALGYSQTFTMGSSGSTGELYISRSDKKLLGVGQRIGFASPWGDCAGANNEAEYVPFGVRKG